MPRNKPSVHKAPPGPILSLIWPDDSILRTGDFFGPNKQVVASLEQTEKPGGLGPALWYEVRDKDGVLICEVNASYLSMVIYGQAN